VKLSTAGVSRWWRPTHASRKARDRAEIVDIFVPP
jgi:hypothetical protein